MLEYSTIVVTLFQQNARIVGCTDSKEAVVIDPGGEAARILAALEKSAYSCKEIWLTHSHLDHCGGVQELIEGTGAKLYGHEQEKFMRESVEQIAHMYGVPPEEFSNCPEPDEYISGGETLSVGSHNFDVLFTPGHSPGHVCFYNEASNTLLAGDTLFAQSIGRTDLPGGDHQTLIRSIKEQLFTLPDETRVLSGHGPDTQIGVEKVSNPFLV